MTVLPWSSRRGAVIFLTIAALFLIAFLSRFPPQITSNLPHEHHRKQRQCDTSQFVLQSSSASPSLAPWTFDTTRDARKYGMTEDQCDAAFPEFYAEIDRASSFWQDKGGVKESDLGMEWQKESGMMRLLIHDQQLVVIQKKWAVPAYDVTRALALLHSISRAIITSPEPLPNIEFTVNVGDWPNDPSNTHPVWVLSRATADTAKWVVPDFGYWSWPLDVLGEYNEVRRRIQAIEPDWQNKHEKAVWRGATATNGLRDALLRASEGKDWSDIKAIQWKDGAPVVDDGSGRALTAPEHCRYKYVVHTEGHSYSGRGKYLLNCNSVSIIHEQEWIEPHTHLYKAKGPDQNIIAVKRDFLDLDNAMSMLKNDTKAQRIATNSVNTFRDRYLTPAAQTCYWRKMIWAWAEVSRFDARPYIPEQRKEGDEEEQARRGTPYESFVADLLDPAAK